MNHVQEDISIRYIKKHSRTNIRKYSVSQRVVDTLNKLPASVVESKTVNMFKSQLNTYWKNLDIQFMPDAYGPEVTGNTQSRRVSGAPGPDV
jgi:hypothetical protein